MFQSRGYCRSKLYIAGIGIFEVFAPVTLTLTWWPSNTNLTRIPWTYTRCANTNFLCRGFRKLSSDRQTDTTEIIYYAASRVVSYLLTQIRPTTIGAYIYRVKPRACMGKNCCKQHGMLKLNCNLQSSQDDQWEFKAWNFMVMVIVGHVTSLPVIGWNKCTYKSAGK